MEIIPVSEHMAHFFQIVPSSLDNACVTAVIKSIFSMFLYYYFFYKAFLNARDFLIDNESRE